MMNAHHIGEFSEIFRVKQNHAIAVLNQLLKHFGEISEIYFHFGNKQHLQIWTIIISDISPKFLPVLSYLFSNTCRLYCSFIKLCYPELPIPEGNQYTALEFWDARFRNWVPFFSTVMDTVYPTLVEVLDKDPLRLKGIYHVHLSVHCLTARVTQLACVFSSFSESYSFKFPKTNEGNH